MKCETPLYNGYMQLTLKYIVSAYESLKKLLDVDVNISVAYRLNRLIKILEPEIKEFEESRQKLILRYGTKVGEKIEISGTNRDEFLHEYDKLCQITIEVPFDPLPAEEFVDVKLSAIDIERLDRFITDRKP